MKATKIMNSIRDNHPEWVNEFNNCILHNLYAGEELLDAVLRAAHDAAYIVGGRALIKADPLIIARAKRVEKYLPDAIRVDNCQPIRRRPRRLSKDTENMLAWRVFVRSNECDSHYTDIFYATVKQAESLFKRQYEPDVVYRDNGKLCAVIRDGYSWWEYTLEQIYEQI